MQRGYRYMGTFLLSAALGTPLTNAKPVIAIQDHDEHDRDRDHRRVYDPYHKDYHNWDNREDGSTGTGWRTGTGLRRLRTFETQ